MSGAASTQRAGTVSDTLAEILAATVRALSGRKGLAVILDDAGPARLAAADHLDPAEQHDAELLIRTVSFEKIPYLERAAREAVPVYFESAEMEATAGRWPLGAHLALPLVGSDRSFLGVLCVETDRPGQAPIETAAALARVAAIAVQQDRLAQNYAGETQRSQALLDIFQQMNSSTALPQVLSGICRHTVEAFGVSCATIFDLTRGLRGFVQIANHGTRPEVAERFFRYGYAAGRVPRQEEFRGGATVVLSRHHAVSAEDRAWLEALGLHTAALLPLGSGETLQGAFAVGIEEEREFTAAQLLGLGVVAHQATTAMVWARFLRNAEASVRFRAAVSSLAVELNAQTERAPALHLLCSRGRTMFRAVWGALLLVSGERLIEVAADGEIGGAPEALSVSLAANDDPAVRAFTTGEVVFDVGRAERCDGGGRSARSVLAVPLVSSEGPGGVLLFRGLPDPQTVGAGMAGEARILGALAAAVLRNLDLLARLHTANTELRRANVLKDQLLANASHDLRTPLNVIIGYGQLALEGSFGEPPEELHHIISRMVSSACEQLTLVEDLLDLSRIELNILSLRPLNVPIAPLFSEMEFMVSSLLKDRPVRTVVRAVDPQLHAYADPDRLRQILINLVSNAAKFTDEGFIELSAAADGRRIRVSVRDSGIGIAPEDQRGIFEPFSQANEDRAASGAGLGLAISRRLAHMMNGTLTVESELGRGSTFHLSLPAAGSAANARAEHGAPAPLGRALRYGVGGA